MTVKGIEKIWVIGDAFCKSTMPQYFLQMPDKDFYCRTNFEVHTAYCDQYAYRGNLLGRLRSALTGLINREWTLPRLIVIVLEDDVIEYIKKKNFDSHKQIERFLGYLMNEFRKVISTFKELLPTKAKKFAWPHVLWTVPGSA